MATFQTVKRHNTINMNKHAFLITAYKNPEYLIDLIDQLDGERSLFFIHIDKKCHLHHSKKIKGLKSRPNVLFIKETVKINWGSYNHLKALFNLLEYAFQDRSISHFHSLSGACFAIRPLSEILHFFECHPSKQYLTFHPVPSDVWGGNGGLDRIAYYHPQNWLNMRNWFGNKYAIYSVALQKTLGI